MTKRAEWKWNEVGKSSNLSIGPFDISVWSVGVVGDLADGYVWMAGDSSGHGTASDGRFPTLALAQADAVRWLRATIAEMAAMCPEVE